MKAEVARYGLEVNESKCGTTAAGGTIRYLGQEF
jgi:hypothetical protein